MLKETFHDGWNLLVPVFVHFLIGLLAKFLLAINYLTFFIVENNLIMNPIFQKPKYSS